MKPKDTGNGKKAAGSIVKLFITAVALLAVFIIVCLFVFYRQLTPVVGVKKYAGIIAEGRANPYREIYLSHFPDQIPVLSEKTAFFFFPG